MAVSVLRPLVFAKSDVLVAGCFSGLTAAHVAVAASARGSRVLVCGADHTPSQLKHMRELFPQMDIPSKSPSPDVLLAPFIHDCCAWCQIRREDPA